MLPRKTYTSTTTTTTTSAGNNHKKEEDPYVGMLHQVSEMNMGYDDKRPRMQYNKTPVAAAAAAACTAELGNISEVATPNPMANPTPPTNLYTPTDQPLAGGGGGDGGSGGSGVVTPLFQQQQERLSSILLQEEAKRKPLLPFGGRKRKILHTGSFADTVDTAVDSTRVLLLSNKKKTNGPLLPTSPELSAGGINWHKSLPPQFSPIEALRLELPPAVENVTTTTATTRTATFSAQQETEQFHPEPPLRCALQPRRHHHRPQGFAAATTTNSTMTVMVDGGDKRKTTTTTTETKFYTTRSSSPLPPQPPPSMPGLDTPKQVGGHKRVVSMFPLKMRRVPFPMPDL